MAVQDYCAHNAKHIGADDTVTMLRYAILNGLYVLTLRVT